MPCFLLQRSNIEFICRAWKLSGYSIIVNLHESKDQNLLFFRRLNALAPKEHVHRVSIGIQ